VILATARPSTAIEQNESTAYLLRIPGKAWALSIPNWAFTESSQRVDGDAVSFIGARAGDKKQKLSPVTINIRMEPAKAPGDAQAFSEVAKKNLKKRALVVPESVRQDVFKGIPIIRYSFTMNPTFSPQMSTIPRGKILAAYYVKDDTWITAQLNFLGEFRKEDEKYFYALLDSLQIVENVSK
jgi:hypothetical protein